MVATPGSGADLPSMIERRGPALGSAGQALHLEETSVAWLVCCRAWLGQVHPGEIRKAPPHLLVILEVPAPATRPLGPAQGDWGHLLARQFFVGVLRRMPQVLELVVITLWVRETRDAISVLQGCL